MGGMLHGRQGGTRWAKCWLGSRMVRGSRIAPDVWDAGQDVGQSQTGRMLAGMLARMQDSTRQVGCRTARDARRHWVTMTKRALAPLW